MLVSLVVLAVLSGGWYNWEPNVYLTLIRWSDPEFVDVSEAMEARLVACGERAIPLVVKEAGLVGRLREYGGLPMVLGRIGEPARRALHNACDVETRPRRRVGYVLSLMLGFEDFSRVNLWIRDSSRSRGGLPFALRGELNLRYREDPTPFPRLDDDRLDPDFVAWYVQTRSKHPELPALLLEKDPL